MLTPRRIKELLHDPFNIGVLYWRVNVGCRGKADTIAGSNHVSRFEDRWTIQVGGSKYLRSRLVFVIHNDRWPLPGMVIDHIDKDTSNDCIANLREVTQKVNMKTRYYPKGHAHAK